MFDMDAKQEKIFDKVAKDVVDSAINGYNGTIFAYGQTGSGKTFTMTGGTESFDDRGLIPRTLTYVFQQKRLKEEKI
jgi:kinesin family protein 6/9